MPTTSSSLPHVARPAERRCRLDRDPEAARPALPCDRSRPAGRTARSRASRPPRSRRRRPAGACAPARAIATSEPVASRVTSAPALRPPRARRRRGRERLTSSAVVRSVGRFWRVSASAEGPSARTSASAQHSAVSTASAGRNTSRFGHRAQRREMLDRLMGRAVLAEPDRIVGQHEDHALAHQRREADRRPAVVGEDQERAAVGDHAAVQGHAVHGRGHGVLAHAEMDVAAARRLPG